MSRISIVLLSSAIAVALNPSPTYATNTNDTGVTTCANTDNKNKSCPANGLPGQDAEYGPNSLNLSKLDADGKELATDATNHICVRDNTTGLFWEVKTSDNGPRDHNKTYTHDEASKFAQDINTAGLCGYNDWRVPSPQELASIIDFSVPYPGPTIDTTFFPNTKGISFRTTLAAAETSSTDWYIDFDQGYVFDYRKTSAYPVRLVRGQQGTPILQDNGDSTITDAATGLTWARCAEGQSGAQCEAGKATLMTWADALATAQQASIAGHDDWRLPNIKELHSLTVYGQEAPIIPAAYFPNAPGTRFWSSTPFADNSNYVWVVNFGYGYVDGRPYQSDSGTVRLVRSDTTATSTVKNSPSANKPVITANTVTSTDINTASANESTATATIVAPPLDQVSLAVAISGAGIVTGLQQEVCEEQCVEQYAPGTIVTLQARAYKGANFAGWNGDCKGNDDVCEIKMTSARSVTAIFEKKSSFWWW